MKALKQYSWVSAKKERLFPEVNWTSPLTGPVSADWEIFGYHRHSAKQRIVNEIAIELYDVISSWTLQQGFFFNMAHWAFVPARPTVRSVFRAHWRHTKGAKPPVPKLFTCFRHFRLFSIACSASGILDWNSPLSWVIWRHHYQNFMGTQLLQIPYPPGRLCTNSHYQHYASFLWWTVLPKDEIACHCQVSFTPGFVIQAQPCVMLSSDIVSA